MADDASVNLLPECGARPWPRLGFRLIGGIGARQLRDLDGLRVALARGRRGTPWPGSPPPGNRSGPCPVGVLHEVAARLPASSAGIRAAPCSRRKRRCFVPVPGNGAPSARHRPSASGSASHQGEFAGAAARVPVSTNEALTQPNLRMAVLARGGRTISQDTGPGDAATLVAVAIGVRVVDSILGDLTGEGRDIALLVIEVPPKAHIGPPHTLEVALMQRDATGRLRRVATNSRLITGRSCAATPGYLQAEPGVFTVVDPGAEYRFFYDMQGQEWVAGSVVRCVADAGTGRIDRQELTPGDFGRITFERFDPVRLPLP